MSGRFGIGDETGLSGAPAAEASLPGKPVVDTLTLLGGRGKDGTSERFELTVAAGQVVCVVGPTGSGKSQLLADVECLAQGDTPSGRHVLVDGRAPTDEERFSAAGKLVAQLSQSMNYVLELEVGEFLTLHARSRAVPDAEAAVRRVVAEANGLCGEPFDLDTRVCALSGGQSRSLMIADVAWLSSSPIVLIDELENAGVDRRRALALLVRRGKIALVATHDPLLMLLGERRLAMAGGAVATVLDRTPEEERCLAELERVDARLGRVREALRRGESLGEGAWDFADVASGKGRAR